MPEFPAKTPKILSTDPRFNLPRSRLGHYGLRDSLNLQPPNGAAFDCYRRVWSDRVRLEPGTHVFLG